MKNSPYTIKWLSWIACIAAVLLLAAPAVSAGDSSPYSTYDPGLFPAVNQAFLGPPVITGPEYIPLSQNYGAFIQPVIITPSVVPVSPAITAPSLIIGNSGYVAGAYYEGSVPISSSYSGSGWDWFRNAGTGGMCGGF
jgi:hypothetical protein